ncbi:hypothetical protein, partial [Streptomyces sp. NPDC054826]
MRNSRALAAAGAAVAVLGLGAPVAVADAPVTVSDGGGVPSPSNITAMPSVIARGGQLAITVDGCPNGGHATSHAFPRTNLTPVSGQRGTSRGTATINSDARPGPYDITVHCSGRTLTRSDAFTVIGGVRGGLGGSSTTGATPTDMAIGGGLVAAAVAAARRVLW